MRLVISFLTCALCLLVTRASGFDGDVLSRRGSISFENADITVSIKTPNGEKIAEAFNATTSVKDPRKMRWVSLGIPRLLIEKNQMASPMNSSLKFVPGGFYIFVSTLSADVALELSREASQKYEVNIGASQFLAIDKHIESFECFLKLFLSDNESFVKIIGRADSIANPIAVFFELPRPIQKYILIIRNETNPLVFHCTIEARGRNRRQSSMSRLNASKIEELTPLEERLNGGLSENTITRNQFLIMSAPTNGKSASFTEQISLSSEDFHITDILSEWAEAIKKCAIAEFKSLQNATARLRDTLNQTLGEIHQLERNTNSRIDCAIAMSTRDDYMISMLRGANLSACSELLIPGTHSYAVFKSNGTFTVPLGVHSVRALGVGGGAGGGSGVAGGGGSGYVRVGESLAVTPLAQIRVTVGRGGRGSTMKMMDETQNGGGGGRSAFGSLLSAEGGVAISSDRNGGNGGSGGGSGFWNDGNAGTSGAGGTDGGNGGSSTYRGGTGQGTFSQQFGIFRLNSFTAGTGGGSSSVRSDWGAGGGGGGGVLMNGEGPSGGRGQLGNTFGGNGYGSGGAGGAHWQNSAVSWPWYAGGDGADGLVYVEW